MAVRSVPTASPAAPISGLSCLFDHPLYLIFTFPLFFLYTGYLWYLVRGKNFLPKKYKGDTAMKHLTILLALLLLGLGVNVSVAKDQAVSGLQEATFVVG
jgi:hypothetical protein